MELGFKGPAGENIHIWSSNLGIGSGVRLKMKGLGIQCRGLWGQMAFFFWDCSRDNGLSGLVGERPWATARLGILDGGVGGEWMME